MLFERIKTPGIAHLAYLIGNQGDAAVIDPRRDVDEYLALARKHKLTIKYVIETHRQEDFVMGSAELARQCGAKVINGRHPNFGHGDIRLADGEWFEIAKGIRIVALHTPGHTPKACATGSTWKTRRTTRGRRSPGTLSSLARLAAPT